MARLSVLRGAELSSMQQKTIEVGGLLKDNRRMSPSVMDKKRRIRGRKLAVQKPKSSFPRGSFLKYLTAQRDLEQLAILAGCVQGPVDSR